MLGDRLNRVETCFLKTESIRAFGTCICIRSGRGASAAAADEWLVVTLHTFVQSGNESKCLLSVRQEGKPKENISFVKVASAE